MSKRRLMHFMIMFVLTLIIWFLPTFGQITEMGMHILATFVGVLYGWIFIDLVWPSIFGFICLGISGFTTVVGAVASGFGNQSLVMILITMAFAGALDSAGLTTFLSEWFLKRKIIQKSPWFLIVGIIFTAFILSILGAGLAAIFILWSLMLKIADECNFPKQNHLISFCIMMICVGGMNGGNVMPFGQGSLIWTGFLTQATGMSIPYIPFIVYAFLMYTIIMLIMIIVCKFIYKLDASSFKLSENILNDINSKHSTKGQRISFIILIVYMAALLLPCIFSNIPGMSFLAALGVVGVSAITLLVMNFIEVDNKPLINISSVFQKHTQWPIIILLAVTFPLADAIKAEETGIMTTVMSMVTPLVENMTVTTLMIISMIILGLLTQITHNIVLGAMFIPFLCPLVEAMNGNPITMFFLLFITLQCAYMTPAASMNAAMVHSHDRMIKKDAYVMGTLLFIINVLVLAVIGIPFGNMLF